VNEHYDSESTQSEPYVAPANPVKSRGSCLLYGCLTFAVVMIVLVVGSVLSIYWTVQGQFNKYTSDQPAELPSVEYTDEEYAALDERITTFKDAIGEEGTSQEIIFTTEELNALISRSPELKDKIYIDISDGQVSGEVSLPIDFLPGGKGKYFNATASFNVSLENGILIVTLADATVNGEKVPQPILDGLARNNLAGDAYQDPEMAGMLRRIDSLTIEEDRIILKTRQSADSDKSQEPVSTEDSANEIEPGESEDVRPEVEALDESTPLEIDPTP